MFFSPLPFAVLAAFQWCLPIVQRCCRIVLLHTVGSRCVHTHPTQTLLLLLTSQKPHAGAMKRQRLLLPWFVGGCWPHKHPVRHQLLGNVHTSLWWAPRTINPILHIAGSPPLHFSLHSWFSISQFIVLVTQMMDCDILLRCPFQPVFFPQAELPLSFGSCKCHVAMHCYGKL